MLKLNIFQLLREVFPASETQTWKNESAQLLFIKRKIKRKLKKSLEFGRFEWVFRRFSCGFPGLSLSLSNDQK